MADLEKSKGVITLSDGSKIEPRAAIDLINCQARLRRALGREPCLADYPAKTQAKLRGFARWTPDSDEFGQIAFLAVLLGRSLTADLS